MRWYFEKMNKKEMTDDFQGLSVFFLFKRMGKRKILAIQQLAEWQREDCVLD